MQRPDVTLVVLALPQRPASVETCLQALHPTLGIRDEVLVVPADATAFELPYGWLRVVPRGADETTAQATDRAIASARHGIVLTVTSDVVATPDWLGRLVAPLRDSTVAAASARSNRSTTVAGLELAGAAYDPQTVDELSEFAQEWHWTRLGTRTDQQVLDSFCLALRVEAWAGVGGFAGGTDDPCLAIPDFCARLIGTGWTLLVADDVFVHRADPGSAFDEDATWNFRGRQDEIQLHRTKELGHALGLDPEVLRQQFSEPPLPYPQPLRPAPVPAGAVEPAPRVSVVVPTFNRPLLLRRALESVQAQTVLDPASNRPLAVEVLVVNDGGPDVRRVVAEFATTMDIRLIEHARTRGRAAACNTGLVAARGELVGFLDDDDFLFPYHLETLVAAWDRDPSPRTLVASYAVATTLDATLDALVRTVVGDQPFMAEQLSIGNTIASATLLAPAALLRAEGGLDERLPMFDDWELLLRLTRHGAAVRSVPVPTVEMFRHERRVGNKEIRRTHESLLHVYRQHPVARLTNADKKRIKRVEDSLLGRDVFAVDISVVLLGDRDLPAAVETLRSVAKVTKESRWELLLLAPRADWYQVIMDQLEGDVRVFSVGEMPADEAFAYGEKRAGGRHVLLVEAGQVVDPEIVLEMLSSTPGKARRVGVAALEPSLA